MRHSAPSSGSLALMGRKSKRPRADGEGPKKCDFRQRAHSNPLADVGDDGHPTHPTRVDWHASFPQHFPPLPAPAADDDGVAALALEPAPKAVEWVDVGCGYGGLLMAMAPAFPETLMLGMEIRHKVAEFAHEKILSLRKQQPGSYENIDVIQTNTMKYVPQFFRKGQLSKMLFCFPDPHFKKNTHRRRIISADMNAEYAYCLREGGLAYIVTDVLELHEWMVRHLEEHPLFDRLTAEEEAADPVVPYIRTRTDESIKVERNQGQKYAAVYRRRADGPGWGFPIAACHAAATARILAEARLSGNPIATADGLPSVAGREEACAAQLAMCELCAEETAPAEGAEGGLVTARGRALGAGLGEHCGWKLMRTAWPAPPAPAAPPQPAPQAEPETEAAAVGGKQSRKEKKKAKRAAEAAAAVAKEAAAPKPQLPRTVRAPLFSSALRPQPSPGAQRNPTCLHTSRSLFLKKAVGYRVQAAARWCCGRLHCRPVRWRPALPSPSSPHQHSAHSHKSRHQRQMLGEQEGGRLGAGAWGRAVGAGKGGATRVRSSGPSSTRCATTLPATLANQQQAFRHLRKLESMMRQSSRGYVRAVGGGCVGGGGLEACGGSGG
eukprot:COSAG04_NODE_3052_length_3234_cov_1.629984_1_plen_609_part_00